jgi:hypothetical protein
VRGLYRDGTRILGLALCAVGLVLVVSTLVRGGGPLTLGVILGVAFLLLGAGRFVLAGGRR